MGRGARRRAIASSAAFAELIESGRSPEPTLLGLEQEFSLRDVQGRQVDARALLGKLHIPGASLDPGDQHARRLPWGGVLTADGAEAEIATPPVALSSDAFGRVADLAVVGRGQLVTALPPGLSATGYSTHFSVAMDQPIVGRAAALYASTFACALMLLTDREDSPGVLVRPRPGRLELCTEYVESDRLRDVVTFAAGSVLAIAHAITTGDRSASPPGIALSLAPATDRFGWYVDRRAFGIDLHEKWGATVLTLDDGSVMTASEYLELAWACVQAHIDAMESETTAQTSERSAFGEALEPRRRPAFSLLAQIATWDFTVYRIDGSKRTAFACIPRWALARFLDAIDAGELDDAIQDYLRAATGGRPLMGTEQTGTPGLFAAVGQATSLLTPEEGLAFTGGGPRRGKRRRDHDEDHEQKDQPDDLAKHHRRDDSRRVRRMSSKAKLVATGAMALIVAIAAIAIATSKPGSSEDGASQVNGAGTGSTSEQPLSEARVEGIYRRMDGEAGPMPVTMEMTPTCAEGPCGASVAGKDPSGPVIVEVSFRGGTYAFEGSEDTRCPPEEADIDGPDRPWIYSFKAPLTVTEAALIDGVWRATELSGPMDYSWNQVEFKVGINTQICNKGKSSVPVVYELQQ